MIKNGKNQCKKTSQFITQIRATYKWHL